MTIKRKTNAEAGVDATVIDWLLSLTPEERLAELESRIAFFREARRSDADPDLTSKTRTA